MLTCLLSFTKQRGLVTENISGRGSFLNPYQMFFQMYIHSPLIMSPDSSKRWKRLDSLIPNRFTFDEFHIAHLTGATRIKEDIYPKGVESPKWIHIDEDDGYCGALAPVFDMINHSSTPNCMWDYDSDSVKIITLRSVEKDEELFIDYGYRRGRNSLIP